MDKSWKQIKDLLDPVYENGVEEFLNFVFDGKDINCELPCPCNECNNSDDQTKEIMGIHSSIYGIVGSYDIWVCHGEALIDEYKDDMNMSEEDIEHDEIPKMLSDIGATNVGDNWLNREEFSGNISHDKNGEATKFLKLLAKVEGDLYLCCKNDSNLAFIVNILHLKTMNKWTCKYVVVLLKFLKHVFPMTSIPTTFYEAKSIIRDLGLKSEKKHACENECVLYMKEYHDLKQCPNENCKTPRYKSSTSKIPRKVLSYFPLKPRLRRLFVNKKLLKNELA